MAPIPVHGRHPLVIHTIARIRRQTDVQIEVICIGGKWDREVCERAGAHFIERPNHPLGAKWQAGFAAAREFNPDAVLYMGSADWLCDQWCSTLMHHAAISTPGRVLGKRDYYYLNIGQHGVVRGVYWPGYPETSTRHDEAIGGGRLIYRDALQKAKWKAFDETWDSSMDWSLQEHVGCARVVEDVSICAAEISTNRWGNKHSFEALTTAAHCQPLDADTTKRLVDRWFPEVYRVFPEEELQFHGVPALPHGRQHRRDYDRLPMQCLPCP